MELFSPERMQEYADAGVAMLIQYVPTVLLAIVVLVVGLWLIKRLR